MRAIIAAMIIMLAVGCAHVQPDPGTIGPCYGSMQLTPNISGCYYDTNYDKEPDIVLFYVWDGERMQLFMSRTIVELAEMMEEDEESYE